MDCVMLMKNGHSGFEPVESNDDVLDLWGAFLRHWRIVVMAMVVTTSLGILYYFVAPPTYRSTASLLIETKRNPMFDEHSREDRLTEIKNVETHAFTIRSRMIVSQAFDDFELDKLESLQALDDEKVDRIQFVIDGLSAEVAEDETSAIALSYEGSSDTDCEQIVAAITQTYENYLGEKIQDISTKTSTLIVSAKDELLKQIEEKEAAYHEFQRNAPLMWKSGEGINIHRERQTELERERSAGLIARAKLIAKIEATELALARGNESRDAIYFEAIRELCPKNDDEDFIVEREAARGYSVELSREYVDLVMKVKELSERFGSGHPDLISLQARAEAMREMLDLTLGNKKSEGDPLLGPAVNPFSKSVDYVEVYRHLLRERITAVDTELREFNEAYKKEQECANSMQIYMAEDQMKRSDIERLTKLFDAVVARLEEITLIRDYGGDTMRVLETARLGEKVAPNPMLVLLMSLVTGTIFGLFAAIAVDFTEATFRNPSEIRKVLESPVIGSIPQMDRQSVAVNADYRHIDPMICTAHRQGSNAAEAYRAVRTALFFSGANQQLKVLQITSPMPGDGKSTLISNVAVSIARSGKRVVILAADFRKPTIHTLFGIDGTKLGLSHAVAGDVDVQEVTHATRIPNLDIVAAGCPPENPSELLSSDKLSDILQRLRKEYDFVLIDTPPLLAVTDPSIVSARVDGVIMAVRIYKGVREGAKRSKEILDSMGANLIGVVINGIQHRTTSRNAVFGYGSYGYGETDPTSRAGGAETSMSPLGSVTSAGRRKKSNGTTTSQTSFT
jgi:succinoglycan biosynthesis transport protein ExoP